MARAHPRLDDARHEAAHAVVAWLCGYRGRLSLVPTADSLAHFSIASRRHRRRDAVLIAVAGVLVSCLDEPAAWMEAENAADIVDAVRDCPALDPVDPAQAFADACAIVRTVLGWPRIRAAIEVLARALSERTTLEPDEIDAIIGQTIAAPPTRRPRA